MVEFCSFFETEKAVPDPSLAREGFPEDFAEAYRPSINRVVLEYTDAEAEQVMKMLGLQKIEKVVYSFKELGK